MGVPEIVPVAESKDSPVGNVPDCNANEIGVSPVTASVLEYGVEISTVPKVVSVMAGVDSKTDPVNALSFVP